MSSKFMKSAAVLGTATLASLLLVACGSKTADKAADTSSSEAKEITFYVEDQYKAYAEKVAAAYEKESGTKVNPQTFARGSPLPDGSRYKDGCWGGGAAERRSPLRS